MPAGLPLPYVPHSPLGIKKINLEYPKVTQGFFTLEGERNIVPHIAPLLGRLLPISFFLNGKHMFKDDFVWPLTQIFGHMPEVGA